MRFLYLATLAIAGASAIGFGAAGGESGTTPHRSESLLDSHVLVTWYGNPHSSAMGVLGQADGTARAAALRHQAVAYAPHTAKRILPAYHLVAVVAQNSAGADGRWRRRESLEFMTSLLDDARSHGFAMVLDVQPGRSSVEEEIEYLRPMLAEPDVHLALDPEFDMSEGQQPGRELGHMHATDVNAALDLLEHLHAAHALPPKILIVHQFTIGMLPDKQQIRLRDCVDLVLDMDGFGSQSLKRASYRTINRQFAFPFAGLKLFYRQDRQLFDPADVMRLDPVPSVVIYQ